MAYYRLNFLSLPSNNTVDSQRLRKRLNYRVFRLGLVDILRIRLEENNSLSVDLFYSVFSISNLAPSPSYQQGVAQAEFTDLERSL